MKRPGEFLSVTTNNLSAVSSSAPDLASLERELAALCVSALNLDMVADEIDPAAALYGDGLGLDSIDILELALEVSRCYGFELRSDDEHNHQIFQSLRTLAAHVVAHRTR